MKKQDLVSAGGMQVFAASNGMERSPKNFFNVPLSYRPLAKLDVMFTKCGHLGPKKAKLNFWGQGFVFEIKGRIRDIMKKNCSQNTTRDEVLCPECTFGFLKVHAIRCVLCGHGILPGDPVALYDNTSKIPNIESGTSVGGSVIGCLLWNCCPSGGFFAGHWTEEGFKQADFKTVKI